MIAAPSPVLVWAIIIGTPILFVVGVTVLVLAAVRAYNDKRYVRAGILSAVYVILLRNLTRR